MKAVAVGKTVLLLDLVGQPHGRQWLEVSRVEVDDSEWAKQYAEKLDAEFNPKPTWNNVKDAGAEKDDSND